MFGKIEDYFEETEEYVTGVGHIPAKFIKEREIVNYEKNISCR